MEFNPDFDLPADVKAQADQTIQGIIDGSIVVGEAPPPPPAEEFVFGMVLVGPKNDHGWSQAHYEGGLFVEQNMPGARMIVFESLNPPGKKVRIIKRLRTWATSWAAWKT
jgi:basic membrane lipoprotein Med (substrate-binding protein (PBP1-ABC) superfamily)